MPDYTDVRGQIIARMNAGRASRGYPVLTPRQEHLVREFFDDTGRISDEDASLLESLLRSNSA